MKDLTVNVIDDVERGLMIIEHATVDVLNKLCKDRVDSLMFIGEFLERKHEGEEINVYSSVSGLILSLNIVEHELTIHY